MTTPAIEAVAFDVNETLFTLDRLRPAFTDAGRPVFICTAASYTVADPSWASSAWMSGLIARRARSG